MLEDCAAKVYDEPGRGSRGRVMTLVAQNLSPELQAKQDRLASVLRDLQRVVIAFSGGIDSTVVAQAASTVLGENAVAVTADSPSVPRAEIAEASELAQQIGIRHIVVGTEEFADPDYVRNDGAR